MRSLSLLLPLFLQGLRALLIHLLGLGAHMFDDVEILGDISGELDLALGAPPRHALHLYRESVLVLHVSSILLILDRLQSGPFGAHLPTGGLFLHGHVILARPGLPLLRDARGSLQQALADRIRASATVGIRPVGLGLAAGRLILCLAIPAGIVVVFEVGLKISLLAAASLADVFQHRRTHFARLEQQL